MNLSQPWPDARDFAAFFDETVERAFRLALLATRDSGRALAVTRRAYADFWLTSREPDAARPEVRADSYAQCASHAQIREGAEGGTRTPTP